ncbi:MAG: HAD family hydrolase [Clostridia bacterium]|nr:HAD family hydrolase [Clostridia bacterium]
MTFDNIVLLSDIDGTLATYDRVIQPKNIEAIQYFVNNGGRFAVATGRTAHSAERMIKHLSVNCPCITVNGAAIYDYQQNKLLHVCYLNHCATELFKPVVELFPQVGIEINVDGVLKCVRYSPRSEEHIIYELGTFEQFTMNDIPEDSNWFKAIFTGAPDILDQVQTLCESMITETAPYYLVRSEPTLFEILPKDATKGDGVRFLSKHLSVPIDNIYAIGDYYNDIDFLSAAGYSAAVKNAPQEVLAVTDYVTCSCEDGAVADFIAHIERIIKTSK